MKRFLILIVLLACVLSARSVDYFGAVVGERFFAYNAPYGGPQSVEVNGLGSVGISSDGTALFGYQIYDALLNPLGDFHINFNTAGLLMFGNYPLSVARPPIVMRGEVFITHTNLTVAGLTLSSVFAATNTAGGFYGNGGGLTNLHFTTTGVTITQYMTDFMLGQITNVYSNGLLVATGLYVVPMTPLLGAGGDAMLGAGGDAMTGAGG